jgi:hypothetical protein
MFANVCGIKARAMKNNMGGTKHPVLQGLCKRPLQFVGLQKMSRSGRILFDLWNPLVQVAEIQAGSTRSGNSLRALGLHVPSFVGKKRGWIYRP